MNANVSKLLNEQINKEFYSAYLYLDFANYYAAVGLDGFENWYRCPIEAPLEAPEKRPSVINATESPSPIPAIAEVGFNISLIPGPPFGPS